MEKKTSSKPPHLCQPTAALKAAIVILEQFASNKKSKPLMQVTELAVNGNQLVKTERSRLKKIINFFGVLLSSKARERLKIQKAQVQSIVQGAIKTVKRNHLIIDKLKDGNAEEQLLAASTLEAIKHFNSALEKHSRLPNWKHDFFRFLFSRNNLVSQGMAPNPIELPKLSSDMEKKYTGVSDFLSKGTPTSLSPQETDIIRMKANTLLRQHGIRFKTAADAFNSVKHAPIHATLNSQSQLSTLCLTLDVLPGTTIKIIGSFKRGSPTLCAPIPDSFHLSITSNHSGFPHPLQYTGWAFSEDLIPIYPHHLDQMPLFQSLYHKKNKVSAALQPDGHLLDQAKQVLQLKQEVFRQYRQPLLELHQELCLAVLPTEESTIIDFFTYLKTHEKPFELLSEAFKTINFYFSGNPHAKLRQAWSERAHSLLFSSSPSEVFKGAHELLEEESKRSLDCLTNQDSEANFSPAMGNFILLFGRKLDPTFRSIILQHWSETLEFAPPQFSDIERKILAVTYNQLQSFLEEFDWDLEDTHYYNQQFIYKRLQKQMQEDIFLFKSPFKKSKTPSTVIVQEVEHYFSKDLEDSNV